MWNKIHLPRRICPNAFPMTYKILNGTCHFIYNNSVLSICCIMRCTEPIRIQSLSFILAQIMETITEKDSQCSKINIFNAPVIQVGILNMQTREWRTEWTVDEKTWSQALQPTASIDRCQPLFLCKPCGMYEQCFCIHSSGSSSAPHTSISSHVIGSVAQPLQK